MHPIAVRWPAPATWGHSWAPSSAARSDSSISSRHRSGAPSIWSRAKVTGRPMAADSRRIQSTSLAGATMSSPATPVGRELEDPGAQLTQGGADAEQLVLGRVGARDGLTVDGPVGDGARGGEPERAGGHGFLDDRVHRRDVVGRGRLVAGPALAHDVGAHRAVGDLGADVHGPATVVQGVEVLGEALPAPRHALGQRSAGDVLDPLHQPDEPVVLIGLSRSEADTAVAHHDRWSRRARTLGARCRPRWPGRRSGCGCRPSPGVTKSAVGIDGPRSRCVVESSDLGH